MTSDELHVVVGVIRKENRILITKRSDGTRQGGFWEFPGGKVEKGENPKQALIRELNEEINIDVINARPLIKYSYIYSDYKILLDAWIINDWRGQITSRENQPKKWILETDIDTINFPAANLYIVKAIKLAPLYLICPVNNEEIFDDLLIIEKCIKAGIRLLQLRFEDDTIRNDPDLIKKIVSLRKKYNTKILLNSTPEQSINLMTNGVHLSSQRLMELNSRPLSKKYLVGASCHNKIEIDHARKIDVDFVVLSPVNKTKSHPDAQPLGWCKFNELVQNIDIPVYALGGMQPDDINTAWHKGAHGVAIQSYIWSSPDPEGAVKQCMKFD